jgi:hypothetical protein
MEHRARLGLRLRAFCDIFEYLFENSFEDFRGEKVAGRFLIKGRGGLPGGGDVGGVAPEDF